jgi:hypothetical protein
VTTSRPGSARYLCDRCGRDLSDRGLSTPCLCGGLARRRVDGADAVYRRPETADPPRWDPLKDWTAKYLQLVWTVQQLRLLYAPDSDATPDEVRGIVESSVRAVASLGEWLLSGPEPAAVTPGDVERALASEPLSVCAAFGAGEVDVTTQLLPIAFSAPPRLWVEHRRPNARPVRYDALDLLDRCLRTWQAFLKERGVQLPSWQD